MCISNNNHWLRWLLLIKYSENKGYGYNFIMGVVAGGVHTVCLTSKGKFTIYSFFVSRIQSNFHILFLGELYTFGCTVMMKEP
jgi:hypothetical protein